jgi:hypothetical protein
MACPVLNEKPKRYNCSATTCPRTIEKTFGPARTPVGAEPRQIAAPVLNEKIAF